MSDETILQEAESLINGDRQQQYGGASESFTRIGDLWAGYLGVPVTALDVANLMVLLKVSRTKGKYHRDSYVDIAGYSALAERITAEDATLGVLLDTPLEYVEPIEPRVWQRLNDVPIVAVVEDSEGDRWSYKDDSWHYQISVHGRWRNTDNWSDDPNNYGPFTEVIR